MALKGNLRDFTLHQLLNLINLAHKTGELTIASSNGHNQSAYLYFREGKLIHAAWENNPPRLTDVLVQAGKLSADQAQAIGRRSRVGTDKEIGLLLMHSGYLSQTDIIQGVRSYLLETVYQLFTWPGGDFHFEANQFPPDERITVPLNLDSVILEGARRQQEFVKLTNEIPDLDRPLRFVAKPNTSLRSINLSVDEWKFISFINSRNTVRQITAMLGTDEFQSRRIVQRLSSAGLVEMTRPQVVQPELPPEPAEPLPRKPAPGAKMSRGLIMRIIDGIRRR